MPAATPIIEPRVLREYSLVADARHAHAVLRGLTSASGAIVAAASR
jgi:hypothetical protein